MEVDRARHRLSMPENARKLHGEYLYLRSVDESLRTLPQHERYRSLNAWYNNVYRKADEDIERLQAAGDRSTADALRRGLEENSKPYQR